MRVVRLWNPIRNTVLGQNVRIAHSHRDRMIGLLKEKTLTDGKGLLLQGTRSIHTFGMRFPIDVIYLDVAGRVLCTIHSLPPNHIGPFRWGVHAVLEMGAGTIERSQTQVGDFLKMDELSE